MSVRITIIWPSRLEWSNRYRDTRLRLDPHLRPPALIACASRQATRGSAERSKISLRDGYQWTPEGEALSALPACLGLEAGISPPRLTSPMVMAIFAVAR